jgi:hypothetical protein
MTTTQRTTQSTRPIPQLPDEAVRVLYDGSKRVAYGLAMEIVELLQRDPEPLLLRAREWRRRHPLAYGPDREMWDGLLTGPVEELCRQLLRLDDRGEHLRDTMPIFGGIDDDRRMAIARRAHRVA